MKKRVLISFTFVVVIILILVFYIKIHNNKEADVKINYDNIKHADIENIAQNYWNSDGIYNIAAAEDGYYHFVSLMPNGNVRQANLKILFEKAREFENTNFSGLFNFINFIDRLKSSGGDLSSAKLIGENEDVIRIMSIHKSKGLEFPIVFLCNTGKEFNMKDLNENIILHQELGIGPKFIDTEKN